MQTTGSQLKVFSPVPIRSTNFNIGIDKVVYILNQHFGDNFRFSSNGDENIYIENIKTGSKNTSFLYKSETNFATTPWTLAKTLVFKQYYAMNAHSEESIYDPSESDIIQFAQRCLLSK